MRPLLRLVLAAALSLAAPSLRAQPARPVSVVAAENMYGDIAAQVAGPDAAVSSILSNPDQDPHLFAASPSTARRVAEATVVIGNGLDYDPWIIRLLRASRAPERRVITVAELLRRPTGSNPHLWYDPAAAPALADALARALSAALPSGAAGFAARAEAFKAGLRPLAEKVASLRARFAGQPVTATEPVFGLMAAALGLTVRNERFQLAVMNGTEPRPSDVAAFEADLRNRRVRLLIYNSQATAPAARRLLTLAQGAGIPVLGVTETQPEGTTYQGWMLGQLEALEAALGQAVPGGAPDATPSSALPPRR